MIDKDRAFAAFLPTISLSLEFMLQGKTSLAAGNPLIAEFVPVNATDVPGLPEIWIFTRFVICRPCRQLESTGRMQRALLLDHQAILMLDVARAYFQVMHSEKQVRYYDYSIETGDSGSKTSR